MPCFKFGEPAKSSTVGHHMAIFDLAHGLPANADDVAQLRLRHPTLATQAFEAAGNFGFTVWSHALSPIASALLLVALPLSVEFSRH
jgi:hypothetical protein